MTIEDQRKLTLIPFIYRENNISFVDHDFMLTPMNEATGSRPISRVQAAQALQKPNEVDATNLIISPTEEISPTNYTGSTAVEENRAVPPVNPEIYNGRLPAQ